MSSFVLRDGKLISVPDTVVTESCELRQTITNTLIIRSGARVATYGGVSGTVVVESGASLDAHGSVGGTVEIQSGGEATFHGIVGGTIHVSQGGLTRLAPTATAFGSILVDGTLINEGVRGIQVHGTGTIHDQPGATVRLPDETHPDGTTIYRSSPPSRTR